jgi:peptidyl-tRNA hydrolase, PTH2 family
MEYSQEPLVVKQVIVIRRDLKMRRGKEIAQGAHASMAWLSDRIREGKNCADGYGSQWQVESLIGLSQVEYAWLIGAFTKVTCQVPDLEVLLAVHQRAISNGVRCHVITDSGRTEFGGIPTMTALAVGPDRSDVIDQVTGGLALY